MVSLDDVKRDKKSVIMSIRTTEEISEWMKDNDVSPSLVFHKAVEELRKRRGEREGKERE